MLGGIYSSLHYRKGHGYRKWDLEFSAKFVISPDRVHRHMSLSSCYGAAGNMMCSAWKFGGFTTRQLRVKAYSTLLIFKLWFICFSETNQLCLMRHYFVACKKKWHVIIFLLWCLEYTGIHILALLLKYLWEVGQIT